MIIDASISVSDLNEDYNLVIPESTEYETLGGYIVMSLQRIPKNGDTVDFENKRFRIIEMVAQRIAKVKMEIIEA